MADQRTAHTRVFAMSDGTFEAELSSEPESYRDGQGRWQPVDTTVRPGGRDGFRLSNDTNAFGSSFGDRTDRLARFELGDRQVTLGLDGGARAADPKATAAPCGTRACSTARIWCTRSPPSC